MARFSMITVNEVNQQTVKEEDQQVKKTLKAVAGKAIFQPKKL